jgi:hypothetical protein
VMPTTSANPAALRGMPRRLNRPWRAS